MDFDVFASTLQSNKREAGMWMMTNVAMATAATLTTITTTTPREQTTLPTCVAHSLTRHRSQTAHGEMSEWRHTCNLCIPGLDTS